MTLLAVIYPVDIVVPFFPGFQHTVNRGPVRVCSDWLKLHCHRYDIWVWIRRLLLVQLPSADEVGSHRRRTEKHPSQRQYGLAHLSPLENRNSRRYSGFASGLCRTETDEWLMS